MARIRITGKLTGTLAEAYYKEFCDQHGWAYISLEQIHERGIKKGILKFKKGFDRIYVKIPEEIRPEISSISEPSNKSLLKPSYVYDFLACKIGKWKKPELLNVKERKDFCWVEVKSGMQDLTDNQVRTSKKITIPLYRFRVSNTLSPPRIVDIYWDEVNPEYLFKHNLDSSR